MEQELIIRSEHPDDIEDIANVIQLAFADSPYSDQQEHLIVDNLRRADALHLAVIAQSNSNHQIVGFAGISPVGISDGASNWYGLGPVAVLPEAQGEGIGSMLIEELLLRLKLRGASGCVVLGDPEYYGRFGFIADEVLSFADFDPVLFQSIRFNDSLAQGEVSYHSAFYSSN